MAYGRTTYRHLIGSLSATLKMTFADKSIDDDLIMYWIQAGVNSVKRAELEAGNTTGSYLQTFTQVPVSINYTEVDEVFAKRKYIELPANILDLTNDRAVDWMGYYEPVVKPLKSTKGTPITIHMTTLTQVLESYHLPFGRPTKRNPKAVRINNLLYLWGLEEIPQITVDMALYTSIEPSVLTADIDDEVFLNDEQIGKVLSYVTQLGRFMLSVPSDKRIMDQDDKRERLEIKTTQTTKE